MGPLQAQLLLLLGVAGVEGVPLLALLHPLAAWGLLHPASWDLLLLLLVLGVLALVLPGHP